MTISDEFYKHRTKNNPSLKYGSENIIVNNNREYSTSSSLKTSLQAPPLIIHVDVPSISLRKAIRISEPESTSFASLYDILISKNKLAETLQQSPTCIFIQRKEEHCLEFIFNWECPISEYLQNKAVVFFVNDEIQFLQKHLLSSKKKVPIFGTSPSLTLVRLGRKELHSIPPFIASCLKYLEENDLDTVGLFRISAQTSVVADLKEKIDLGNFS